MKRDMDFVRDILKLVSEKGMNSIISYEDFAERTNEDFIYHIEILEEANLVKGTFTINGKYIRPHLTWAGNDFLETAQDDTRWQQAKKIASSVGGTSFQIFQSILTTILEKQVRNLMGMP